MASPFCPFECYLLSFIIWPLNSLFQTAVYQEKFREPVGREASVTNYSIRQTAIAIEPVWGHRPGPFSQGLTSGARYIGAFSVPLIGLAVASICYSAIVWKGKFGYDGSLHVVGIHRIGGVSA